MGGIETRVIVVCDACEDRTREVAARHLRANDTVVTADRGNVGRARRLGFELAATQNTDIATADAWFATTDADSRVPEEWLARQLLWRARGAFAKRPPRPRWASGPAPVAQLDRALPSEGKGHRFESCRVRQPFRCPARTHG